MTSEDQPARPAPTPLTPARGRAERLAWLHLDGWHGASRSPIVVVGETPMRYRVRADGTRVRLARRWLEPGDPPVLVPKAAVSGRCSFCKGKGTAVAVDAIKADGRPVNPREASCICCDGDGYDHADLDPEEWSDPDLCPQTPQVREHERKRARAALDALKCAPSWVLASLRSDVGLLRHRCDNALRRLEAAGLGLDEEPGA